MRMRPLDTSEAWEDFEDRMAAMDDREDEDGDYDYLTPGELGLPPAGTVLKSW